MIIDSHQHIMEPIALHLEKMERAKVDKAILFCSAPHPEKANSYTDLKEEMHTLYELLSGSPSKEENLLRMNKNIQDLVAHINQCPNKFYGFGAVPLELTLAETTVWIQEHIIANSLKGVGEFTPGNSSQIKQLEVIFQALKSFPELPIWIYTFNPVTLDGIKLLMKLTLKYPNVPVIFGHMGGYHWMEVIEFVKTVPNAYLDLSACFSTLALRIAITELPDKCLYSSDAPYGEPFLSRQNIEFICESDEIRAKVLGENITKLLKL